VFFFNEEKEEHFKMDSNSAYAHAMRRSMDSYVYPYAWVLKAGDNVKIDDYHLQPGDIVRLWDYKTKTVVNPRHTAYTENPMENSNAEKLGNLPELVVSRLHYHYKEDQITIHPTKQPDLVDYHTFLISAPEILGVTTKEDLLNLIND